MPVGAGCAEGVAEGFVAVAEFASAGAPVAGVPSGVAVLPAAGDAPGLAGCEDAASGVVGLAGFDADDEDDDTEDLTDDISFAKSCPLQRK